METIDPRGVAKSDPWDMNGGPLAIAKYQISKLWAFWFQRRRFFSVFPIVSLWELFIAIKTTILIQSAPKPNEINPPA